MNFLFGVVLPSWAFVSTKYDQLKHAYGVISPACNMRYAAAALTNFGGGGGSGVEVGGGGVGIGGGGEAVWTKGRGDGGATQKGSRGHVDGSSNIPAACGIAGADDTSRRYDIRNIHFAQGYGGHGRPWEFGMSEVCHGETWPEYKHTACTTHTACMSIVRWALFELLRSFLTRFSGTSLVFTHAHTIGMASGSKRPIETSDRQLAMAQISRSSERRRPS
jgi:hypothetical protein